MSTAYTRPRILRADQLRVGDQLPFSPDIPSHDWWRDSIGPILVSLDDVDDRSVWLTVSNIRHVEGAGSLYLDLDDRPDREFQPDDELVVREAVEIP